MTDFLTTKEVADRLDIDVSTLARWARAGTAVVTPQRVGQAYIWPAADVDTARELMQERAEKGRCQRRPQTSHRRRRKI